MSPALPGMTSALHQISQLSEVEGSAARRCSSRSDDAQALETAADPMALKSGVIATCAAHPPSWAAVLLAHSAAGSDQTMAQVVAHSR
jgi:hypothetical protein